MQVTAHFSKQAAGFDHQTIEPCRSSLPVLDSRAKLAVSSQSSLIRDECAR